MLHWHPRHTQGQADVDASGLAEESEAFLSGRSRLAAERRGRQIQPWAYLNELAHCRPDHLARLASTPRAGGPIVQWTQAVATLAADVLEAACGEIRVIEAVQRECLAPLEQELLSGADRFVVTPGVLVALTRARLQAHPSAHPPSAG